MKKIIKFVIITVVTFIAMGFAGSLLFSVLLISSVNKAIDDMTDTSDYTESSDEVNMDEMTLGQRNAYEYALANIGMFNESKKNIRRSLEYSEYEEADIDYVMNNLEVDWNLVAVDAAKNYISSGSFSRDGIVSQLTSDYDQFTDEQAEYAINEIEEDIDWAAEAIEAAKDYIEYGTFSKEGLRDQLEYEKFDSEDIESALVTVGY